MKFIRDLGIQNKMLALTLLICGAVLCVAILALFAFQILTFRSTFKRDAETLAVVIANYSTAAMSFKDDQAGNEIVNALRAEPSIVSAALVLPDGSILAPYGVPETSATLSKFPPPEKSRFTGGELLITQPVILKASPTAGSTGASRPGERVGLLYLRFDYRTSFRELLGFYAEVILGVMMVSFVLAVSLSKRLGRTITGPVLQLANTARAVGEKKDYSVRASVDTGADELGGLAASFNEMLGRIQSQDAALSLSQQKMEALVNSIDGIVWERRTDSFQFTFVSRQAERILGYAPSDWLQAPDFWEKKLHPQDAVKAARASHEAAARGQPYTHEYRMLAAGGRTVWIRESGTILMENGRPLAVRGILQDITPQKLDAEKLDKLNRQLIDASRNAGMADVATGVLHNVGNVLNSLGVSSTAVSERLRRSSVTKLRRATALLQSQEPRLADYLTKDPKGKLIPEYLGVLAEELAGEQSEMFAKMMGIGENIEHIKEIVAMQQSYAKVAGVFENVAPAELVEGAVQLNTAAFQRHHIELAREFDENTPNIWVDRHKFLQILINLLRNAKDAMQGLDERSKKLTLRVGFAAPDRVLIVVADNGSGIAPEHGTKIFNHGFTTKKDGHGFGLHSGANAAREMGGRLTAHSDGPGKGATFTLELPVSPKPWAEAPSD